jgi:hypothetical protein
MRIGIMKRKAKQSFDEMCDAVKHRPAPRSQAEWREASRAMRLARRANQRQTGRTIYIECGSFARRIYLESTWGGMRCYNGPGPLGNVGMIGHHRVMFLRGDHASRVEFARHHAAAARRDGPVPLP